MKYSELAELYSRLEATAKRLEKTFLISEFLKRVEPGELPVVILLLEGRVYPAWDQREVGIAGQLMIKAIAAATGSDSKSVGSEWKRIGDLGKVAEHLIAKKKQTTLSRREITPELVFRNIRGISEMAGQGSVEKRIGLIAELLSSAKPLEARYIARTVLGQLRVGLGSGTMRDAIAWAYLPKVLGVFAVCGKCGMAMPGSKCLACGGSCSVPEKIKGKVIELDASDMEKTGGIEKYDYISPRKPGDARAIYRYLLEKVQLAADLSNDFGVVAKTIRTRGFNALDSIELSAGAPVKVMLAQKAESIGEAFETVGRPAAIEFKYDGFRIEAHKDGDRVWLYTRRLENVTKQFPEVVECIKSRIKGKSFIVDCEAVGFDPKTKRYLPFQHVSQRIKRKYDIEKIAAELPVEVNVFDILSYEGRSLINEPFRKRRELLERIVQPIERRIVLARSIVTENEDDVRKFFKESKSMGNEGLMIKNISAPYKPGSRVGYMLKYKETMETLDLVITGAEWGTGKRATWLSSFMLSCRDNGKFLEIGKVGTGIKEKLKEGASFSELTKLLKPLVTEEEGKNVKIRPKVVAEVAYEEIQKSPTYSSGYALRFPRLVRLREDRGANECSTLGMVEEFFKSQRFRHARVGK